MIDPDVTSYSRGKSALIVVLPAPDGPTSAVTDPGFAVKDIPFNISSLSLISGNEADSRDAREICCAFG